MILANGAGRKVDQASGIIYGSNHAYMLSAPDGWVLDNESGKANNLRCVFYPDSSTWKKARSVKYSNSPVTSGIMPKGSDTSMRIRLSSLL